MEDQQAQSSIQQDLKEAIEETAEEAKTKEPKSPTGSTTSGGAGGGWGLWGWVESAKTKSISVLEAVKKDLDELSTVVKEEANAAGEALGLSQPDSTVNAMKKSISSFLGQVSDVLVPPVEDEEAEAIMITKEGIVTLSGFAKHLAELQVNDATFVQEPAEELQSQYKRWLEVVEQDQFTEPRLTKQLTSSQILNEKYLSLVPAKVSHMEFWKRYLFKKALLEDAVANADMAAKRAEVEAQSTKTVVPEKIVVQTEQPKFASEEEELQKWEEDICGGNIELSEEEQARLLEEYEKEIKEREVKPEAAKEATETSRGKQTSKAAPKAAPSKQNPKATKAGKGAGAKGKPVPATASKNTKKTRDVKEESTSDESWEKDFDELEH